MTADTKNTAIHETYMARALELAKQASANDEVPVGAVVVCEGNIIAEAMNAKESHACGTAHAEILAIQKASEKLGRWRLTDCDLYVTLEPCVMCAGAIVSSRLRQVIYGTEDPKAGAVNSLFQILNDERLNHQCRVIAGIKKKECSTLLKEFFKLKRQKINEVFSSPAETPESLP